MSDIFMVIAALLGVVGLLFLTAYATKWLNKKMRSGGWNGGRNGIKIVECMGIAQDKQLLVVKVGNKSMLLGVTPASVTKLSDLDDGDIALLEQNAAENGSTSFIDNLKCAVAGRNGSAYNENADAKQEEDYGRNENDDF